MEVSDTGYWVYCNALKNGKVFDKKLEFEITLVEEKIDDSWVEPTLHEIKACLEATMPTNTPDCEFCDYAKARMIKNLEHLDENNITVKDALKRFRL